MTTRVLVTGATGFVAGHCIAELLEHGYAVRGTVRDLGAGAQRAPPSQVAPRRGGGRAVGGGPPRCGHPRGGGGVGWVG
ncbi:NAD-dependent epimerase/dehydratase family protein, partial [Nocardia sp. NPDC058497]|uniref:NAD-dependent epimerase/dehydratase family protein n=1 Tax=Nocardia sp. NPDC058497 TaxID=3346529 RepID=UPI003660B673